MLTLDPKERITIQQIKQHPWYLGVDDTPRQLTEETSVEPYIITINELQHNSDVVSNLKLLGWEQSELMNELLDPKMNMAKAFFKLLIDHKNLPTGQIDDDTPQNVEKKVLRRRSIGASSKNILVTSETSTTKPSPISRNRLKRGSQRGSQQLTLPASRNPNNATPVQGTLADSGQHKNPATPQSSLNSSSTTNISPKSGDKSKGVIWGVSPTESESKQTQPHNLESTKSVTQILEALRHCFADLGHYDLSAKQTKNNRLKVTVRERKSSKRNGPPVVTVSLLHSRDGETTSVSIKRKKIKIKRRVKRIYKKRVVV